MTEEKLKEILPKFNEELKNVQEKYGVILQAYLDISQIGISAKLRIIPMPEIKKEISE